MPEGLLCEPGALLAENPCIACLSEKEMLAVIVAIMAITASKTIADVVSESACFTCMSRKQMLQALVTMIANDLLDERTSPQDVIDEMHCLVCATEQQLLAAIVKLYCDNFNVSLNQ